MTLRSRRADPVELGSEFSFPASDPPAWMGSTSTASPSEQPATSSADAAGATAAPTLAVPVGSSDHAQGPADAPVTLVVYGDFECPFSRKARTVIRAVRSRRGDSFRYVFRNFPLEDKHPHAFRSSEAAEAAGAQGGYWEMHHALFDAPWALEERDLERYAARLGMDMERFRRDMAEHAHAPRIRADMDGGVRSGVHGTPTYFVNGISYVNLEDDPQRLDDALDRAAWPPPH